MKSRIRHIAIIVPDAEEAAQFYEKAFGFTRAGRARRGIYMTDGVVNVALLTKEHENEKLVTGVRGCAPTSQHLAKSMIHQWFECVLVHKRPPATDPICVPGASPIAWGHLCASSSQTLSAAPCRCLPPAGSTSPTFGAPGSRSASPLQVPSRGTSGSVTLVRPKTTRATIGTYPDLSLAAARQRAEEMRRTVAAGTNPIEAKRRERQQADTKTFGALAERYLNEHARRHKRSVGNDERNLRLHVLPRWRDRRYDEIRRADVIELVEAMVTDGKPTAANRVQALVSVVFSFAMDADLVQGNPCARLRRRGKENVGRRVLTDEEIRLFWHTVVNKPVSKAVGLAMASTPRPTGCGSTPRRGPLSEYEPRRDRAA
jgi:catechol 2,3-dioxygenase-like lactoylglutathione lyase family enzyme